MAGAQSLAMQVVTFSRQLICCANWLQIKGEYKNEKDKDCMYDGSEYGRQRSIAQYHPGRDGCGTF